MVSIRAMEAMNDEDSAELSPFGMTMLGRWGRWEIYYFSGFIPRPLNIEMHRPWFQRQA